MQTATLIKEPRVRPTVAYATVTLDGVEWEAIAFIRAKRAYQAVADSHKGDELKLNRIHTENIEYQGVKQPRLVIDDAEPQNHKLPPQGEQNSTIEKTPTRPHSEPCMCGDTSFDYPYYTAPNGTVTWAHATWQHAAVAKMQAELDASPVTEEW